MTQLTTRISRLNRKSMKGVEVRVWIRIRGRQLDGWKFRRQQPIGPYYGDFYCPAARLVVEIDGPMHDEKAWAYDARRQAWLEAEGYSVLRIPVAEVDRDADGVAATIRARLMELQGLRLIRPEISPLGPSAA